MDGLECGEGSSFSVVIWIVGLSGGSSSASAILVSGRRTRPVACSKVGGGERGRSAEGDVAGGDWEVSKVGGRRLVAVVGKGNAGGGSEDSGRSARSHQPTLSNNADSMDVNLPSQTLTRLMLAPLANPIARPSSRLVTVNRLLAPSSPLTIRLRRLAAT